MSNILKVKKIHPDAILPKYETAGAACFDLKAVDIQEPGPLYSGMPRIYRTGLAFEVPEGHVMLVFPRSGHGFKNTTRLTNCVGVIDSDYRGEVQVSLMRDPSLAPTLQVISGDRIAQACIIKAEQWQLEFAEELSETERGAGGFGSTGSQ